MKRFKFYSVIIAVCVLLTSCNAKDGASSCTATDEHYEVTSSSVQVTAVSVTTAFETTVPKTTVLETTVPRLLFRRLRFLKLPFLKILFRKNQSGMKRK